MCRECGGRDGDHINDCCLQQLDTWRKRAEKAEAEAAGIRGMLQAGVRMQVLDERLACERGARKERAAVVAWLKGQRNGVMALADATDSPDTRHALTEEATTYVIASNAIEAGEHVKGQGEPYRCPECGKIDPVTPFGPCVVCRGVFPEKGEHVKGGG
jgi:hypothetical protein